MCTIDLKHCCQETPGEQVRDYYRKQGYAQGFQEGHDASAGSLTKIANTATHLERVRVKKILENKALHRHKNNNFCQWCYLTKLIIEPEAEMETEPINCPNCNEKRGCSCDWQEDERTGN